MPRDFDATNQIECISGLRDSSLMVATVDGAVHYLNENLSEQTFDQLLIRNDGEVIDDNFLTFVE